MSRRRLGLLLAGLFGGLLLAMPPSDARRPPLTVYSAAPTGGKALWLWLGELGYATATLEASPYRVPDRTGALLVLEPTLPLDRDTLDSLERWVRAGGTLLVAADGFIGGRVLDRFGLGLRALPFVVETAAPLEGAGLDPAIREVVVRATDALALPETGATPLLGDGERVFAAALPFGAGRVLALSAPAALSNRALRHEDNARLALWLIGSHGRGPIVFDELHHGYGVPQPRSLLTLLLDRSWGQAAFYAGLLVLAHGLLAGRRFGRAQPIVVSRGRSLAEYVSSLASLYRAGGKRAFVAEHCCRRLRRDLAQGLGLPGDAADEQIRAAAGALGRDPSRALAAIKALERGGALREGELVALVRDGERAIALGAGR